MEKSNNMKDFSKAEKELMVAEVVDEVYKSQKPVMTAVLSVIPALGPFIDESAAQLFEKYQTTKQKKFVDTVLANDDIITSDKLNNFECIINIAKIIELVDRCTSNDKIVYFGNLIRNGYFDTDEQICNDDFEEYESILKDLSEREIKYLVKFADYARKNNYIMSGKILDKYIQEMKIIYPRINPLVIINRLKRTGFVTEQSAWFDYGDYGDEDDKMAAKGTNGTLGIGNGNEFTLDKGYDDFEKVVLTSYDEKKRFKN